MSVPYIFGYGVAAAVRHKWVSHETKLKLIQHAILLMQPGEEQGLPYGLGIMAAYLAKNGVLTKPMMTHIIIGEVADQMGRKSYWAEDWSSEETLALADWIESADMSQDERLWWFDYFARLFEDSAARGRKIVTKWLEGDALSAEKKRDLCWAWLHDEKNVGTPPAQWRVMQGQTAGDFDMVAQAMRELGAEQAEIDEVIGQMKETYVPLEKSMGGFFLSPGAGFMPDSYRMWAPNYLKRLAVPKLVQLGKDAWSLADMFLTRNVDSYNRDILNSAALDIVKQFSELFTPQQIETLIERGLEIGQVPVRKRAYKLSTRWYGNKYLQRTVDENAASLRKWGAKELAKLNSK